MPIYEFYCRTCNTIFSFFTKKIGSKELPACPGCGGELQRRVSMFSFSDPARGKKDVEKMPLSQARLQEGMKKLDREVERLSDDPQQRDRMLKRFTEISGVRFDEMYTKNPPGAAREAEAAGGSADEPDPNEPRRDEHLYEF